MSSWYYFEAWARPPSGWMRQYAWGPASLDEGAAGAQFQGLVDKLQPAGEYQWVGQWQWTKAPQGWHWALKNGYQAGSGQEQQLAPPGAVPPALSDAVLPDWPSNMASPEGQQKIIDAVLDGAFEHQWCPFQTATINGQQLDLLVSCDALKVNGVRVSVSAATQQQIADMIGGLLLTPKLVDLLYLNADVRPEPKTQPISSTKKAMIDYSARVDAAVGPSQRPLANVGKDWVLVNALFSASAKAAEKAANYGWIVKSDPWQGINTERAASINMYAIQGIGTVHNLSHADYCIAPEARILMADLLWAPAGELVVGQQLVGFDEDISHAAACHHRLSTVTACERKLLECVEIITEWGTIITSIDHGWVTRRALDDRSTAARKWMVRKKAGLPLVGPQRLWKWKRSQDLTVGDTIAAMVKPWKVDESREGGWMAGILDGEGWCSPPTGVGVGQMPGIVLDAIETQLVAAGFELSRSPNKQGVVRLMPLGPRASMQLLGTYRPIRLLPKARRLWEGSKVFCGGRKRPHVQVLSVKYLGLREVVALQTTTKTFICEGLLSHNSQVARFVAREAKLNGQPVDLAQVYTGEVPGMSLISHEGALEGFRQPGVSTSASCPSGVMSEAGICVPKAPAGSTVKKSSAGGLIVGALVGGAIGAATGGTPGAGIGAVAGGIIGTVIA